ncbi:hypothetical protein B0T22DRAFT_439608 [Podospora appendiculata]|uniref:NACHT domain-containing protein n=1 Tax=Podospora appendiculata TaxID=314037 RepID=A0AAE0X8I3_9PEZI|nr:hypothetical protein B0T22DRAFT_439608 [Podospora appendiculata]
MLSASRAKPEVRLGHALSTFEDSLSHERKASFRTYRAQAAGTPPNLEDIRKVVAEFDQRTGKPFGSRFVNVLKAVQQFSVFGDVIVAGAGNIVPSAVWGCVRLTLTKVSELFMDIGQTAPRHKELALLYATSRRLQCDLLEYFIVMVQLCQKLFQRSLLSQVKAHFKLAIVDPELKSCKEQLDKWATSIDREFALLVGQTVKNEAREQLRFRALRANVSETESRRKKLKARQMWLDLCSEYDYEKDRKRIRKQGNTTFFLQDAACVDWKNRKGSSTLMCRGMLGSGKSVLMANMARTVLGCIARQILEVTPTSDLTEVLRKVYPQGPKVFVVLDGLDQCSRKEHIVLIDCLRDLRATFQLLSGELVVGDLDIIDEIRACLVEGAARIYRLTARRFKFLWVLLQLQTICLEINDDAIRQALRDIPRDLPAMFDHTLSKSRCMAPDYQSPILKMLACAFRPLTTDELRAALSIVVGSTAWSEDRMINDVNKTLLWKLIGFIHSPTMAVSIQDAHRQMTGTTVTYLTIFNTSKQLALHAEASSSASKADQPALVPHQNHTLGVVSKSGAMPKHLVKAITKMHGIKSRMAKATVDIQNAVSNIEINPSINSGPSPSQERLFLPYAKAHWLAHSVTISDSEDKPVFFLWKHLVLQPDFDQGVDLTNSPRGLLWAILHSHHPLPDLLLGKRKHRLKSLDACLKALSTIPQHPPLDRAMTTRLLGMNPDLRYGQYAALAARATVARLRSCATSRSRSSSAAINYRDGRTVFWLARHGADVNLHRVALPLATALARMVDDPGAYVWSSYVLLRAGADVGLCEPRLLRPALRTLREHVDVAFFDPAGYIAPPSRAVYTWVGVFVVTMVVWGSVGGKVVDAIMLWVFLWYGSSWFGTLVSGADAGRRGKVGRKEAARGGGCGEEEQGSGFRREVYGC